MAEYHNILTQVQVRGPAEMGLDERGIVAKERGVEPRFSSLLGILEMPSWVQFIWACLERLRCSWEQRGSF